MTGKRKESTARRLRRIADDLDAYARDEGGFSDETRAVIHADAEFLRSLAVPPPSSSTP